MTYALIGLAATTLISGLVAVIFAQKVSAKDALIVELTSQLSAAFVAHHAAAQAAFEEKARSTALVQELHTELAKLEQDLNACSSPDVVRARLRSLLPGTPKA